MDEDITVTGGDQGATGVKASAEGKSVTSEVETGSGMKVKTCEALMYGKNILGTDEAFEGYELDTARVGGRCNNAEDSHCNHPSAVFFKDVLRTPCNVAIFIQEATSFVSYHSDTAIKAISELQAQTPPTCIGRNKAPLTAIWMKY